jgi:UDP-N-acetylmuramoyl-L-alanyl-D-glutamate--2,6-diaminopimelate ligase
MKLRDLFSDDAIIDPQAEATEVAAATEVSGLAVDSRGVKPGDLFFALAGSKTDGARFIDAAIASGAVAVAGDRAPQGYAGAPFVTTANPRRALALAAARFYPRQPATIAAVTGTSGKTSVAAFTRQIWQRLGHASASIGTIGLVSPKRTVYGSLTTPDPIALHRQLDEIAADGVTHLAFEASSHGLDQYRLDGVRISAAGFTNLSRDHMDYHSDVAHYLAAKLRLFRDLVTAEGAAVISADHDCSPAVIDAARQRKLRILAVGSKGDGAGEGIRLGGADIDGFAQKLTLEHCGRSCRWLADSRSRMRWSPQGSRSLPAAKPMKYSGPSNIWREQKAGWNGSANATARRSSSTTRTSRMRWPRHCRRCGLTRNAIWSWCSAPAAIAIAANAP